MVRIFNKFKLLDNEHKFLIIELISFSAKINLIEVLLDQEEGSLGVGG